MEAVASRATENTLHPVVEAIGLRLIERLQDVKRDFDAVLDINAPFGGVSHLLPTTTTVTPSSMLHTFPEEQYDLVIDNLNLSIVDDVQKHLLKNGKALKKDGLFLASVLGVESFREIKEAFYETGNPNGHTALLADIQAYGSVMQQLKFALPVVDREIITLVYPTFRALWDDIRSLGKWNNHPQKALGLTTPARWQRMEEYYWDNFKTEENMVPLTLEVIYLTGWRPDKSQQKPLPVGAKAVPLAEVLK